MNIEPYVGLPWQERGCWELLRLVYEEQLGIVLPSYAAQYTPDDERKAASLIIDESKAWEAIPSGEERQGDAALFTMHGYPTHVGVVVGSKMFLHIRMGQTSTIERYDGPLWSRRLRGFFRHKESK